MEKINFAGRKIILGVTGSIAAFKGALWLRNLRKDGADTTVIMTDSAKKFITPLTFEALSGNRIFSDMFDEKEAESIPHINLAQNSELILIAPATANTISRLANGLADDLLSTVVLAATCPVIICPAMNSKMFLHPATQANLEKLREYGYKIIEPDSGEMACGDEGPGRLPEWEEAKEHILAAFIPQDLAGEHILITAGPTHEPLDPVRFLSNRSSGKMGYAIARAAKLRGAKVTLVSGPTSISPPPGINTIRVRTAHEMLDAVNDHCNEATIVIKAAAVSDYRPEACHSDKIKKGMEKMQLPLTANQDILKGLGEKIQGMDKPPFLVGFAAESTRHLDEGERKLKAKNLDLIVVNDIKGTQTGFGVDTNKVTILAKEGAKEELPLLSKDDTAMCILNTIRQHKESTNR